MHHRLSTETIFFDRYRLSLQPQSTDITMTKKRLNPLARSRANKKAKISKAPDEHDVSVISDGAAAELLKAVEILINRVKVIDKKREDQDEDDDEVEDEDQAAHDRELKVVFERLSSVIQRRQPGNPMTDLPSPEELMALTELLHNIQTVIHDHKNNQLSAEGIARLELNTKNLAIIDIEEGMDSTSVPDWVPEETIDQRKLRSILAMSPYLRLPGLANLSFGNTRQSTMSKAELKLGKDIDDKFTEPDKLMPVITLPDSNWDASRRHLDEYPERQKRYMAQGGETED